MCSEAACWMGLVLSCAVGVVLIAKLACAVVGLGCVWVVWLLC